MWAINMTLVKVWSLKRKMKKPLHFIMRRHPYVRPSPLPPWFWDVHVLKTAQNTGSCGTWGRNLVVRTRSRDTKAVYF